MGTAADTNEGIDLVKVTESVLVAKLSHLVVGFVVLVAHLRT